MDEMRDAYLQKLKGELEEWNEEIDGLAAKASQADTEAKILYHSKLDELREKRKDVEDKIEEIKQAEESGWEGMKHGLENSWEILKESFSKAKSEFERGYKEGMKEE